MGRVGAVPALSSMDASEIVWIAPIGRPRQVCGRTARSSTYWFGRSRCRSCQAAECTLYGLKGSVEVVWGVVVVRGEPDGVGAVAETYLRLRQFGTYLFGGGCAV